MWPSPRLCKLKGARFLAISGLLQAHGFNIPDRFLLFASSRFQGFWAWPLKLSLDSASSGFQFALSFLAFKGSRPQGFWPFLGG